MRSLRASWAELASTSRSDPSGDPGRAARIQQEAFKRNLIIELGGRGGSVLRFLPPLIVGESEIDQIAEGIAAACVAVGEG